ncbi:uncharacterized protein LOC128673571 [Plodia interpunctella]|uniref:uncharacterized protein LOC128673571 n=1 Tax=Plodia interpunctella TaxID=58824 RepID=UPI0023677663|nr:uncharacterized protein LOC128673571 [Plodia interpunctella]
MLALITFPAFLILAQGHPEFIHQINVSSGIYFDPIGELKIRMSHLDVVTPLDISHIEPHLQNINSVLGTTRYICNQIRLEKSYNLQCNNLLEPLTIRYHDIVSEYSTISHLVNRRSRRGAWIGAVGSLSKIVFGTLDENDAIKYDNAIRNVQDNEKRLSSLIKDNILITSEVLTNFNKTLQSIQLNEVSLNLVIDNFSSTLKNITLISNELVVKTNIDFILNSLEASILTLSFHLEDITNAIIFSSQNILHPAVLPPTHLYQEIVNNYRYLPVDLKLPVSLTLSNIHIITNVSSVVCYSIGNKIIFVLKIPLVSPKDYSLYHNIALPTPHIKDKPNTFSFIRPSSKYIAMTIDKSEYCNLDSLKECITISPREYICDVMTVFPSSVNPCCESELLSNTISVLPVQCKTDFFYGYVDLWQPLDNNNWLYVQSKSSKLYIECPKEKLVDINIIGTGILTIPNNCMAHCKSTKLIPKFDNVKINVNIVHSNFNLINDSCCTLDKFNKIISNEPPLKLHNINLDSFTLETKSKLNSIAKETDKILNEHQIIKYETHYSIITIVIICVILIFCITKLIMYIKSRNCLSRRLPDTIPPIPAVSPTDQIPIAENITPAKFSKPCSVKENISSPSIRINV